MGLVRSDTELCALAILAVAIGVRWLLVPIKVWSSSTFWLSNVSVWARVRNVRIRCCGRMVFISHGEERLTTQSRAMCGASIPQLETILKRTKEVNYE